MNGYCACGCGQKTAVAKQTDKRRGHVSGMPKQYVHGHNRYKSDITSDDYTVTDKGYKTPCWIWNGKPNQHGYGRTQVDRKTVLAHRAVYEAYRGSIPESLELDHLCRIPLCVKPEHLEPVTHVVNVRRGSSKSFSPEKVSAAKRLRESGMSISEISRVLGADRGTIRRHLG